MKIKSVAAQEILDSRGNPTVETMATLEDDSMGWAAVPSGVSTGKYEAVELRDQDKTRYHGEGVLKAVENVNGEINQAVTGLEAEDQNLIDETMIALDGTENKARLGANAILSVSLAVAKAEAKAEKKQLFEYLVKFNPGFNGTYIMPIPEMNVMNGGKHANWATDIQEYMLFPVGAKTLVDAVRMNTEVYQTLKGQIVAGRYNANVGDEGGFAPEVDSNEEPFLMLSEAIEKTGLKLGPDIALGIDTAASELWADGKYQLKKEEKTLTSGELAQFYVQLMVKFPIISMEDPFAEDDWEAYNAFTADYADKMQIVGDDLYVTNVKRLQKGIEYKSTNAILIKLNQIGTLSETVRAILLARDHGIASIVSHRSGETEDPFIADLVVAMGTGQIKSGAPARSERVAKYNRLMNIERSLGEKAVYAKFPFVT